MISSDRILIIDDDQDILDLLRYNLQKEGYRVSCLHDPLQAVQKATVFRPTLIILDAVMPQKDGFEVCKDFRSLPEFSEIPIFILTALVESRFEAEAFASGADDFVHKMLGLRSLTKRIELVLRNKLTIRKRVDRIEIGGWQIDRATHSVDHGGKRSQLTPEEFEVLYFFAQNPNRSLTLDHIDKIISGSNLFQLSISLDKCLEGLTYKLGHRWLQYRGKSGFQFNVG